MLKLITITETRAMISTDEPAFPLFVSAAGVLIAMGSRTVTLGVVVGGRVEVLVVVVVVVVEVGTNETTSAGASFKGTIGAIGAKSWCTTSGT